MGQKDNRAPRGVSEGRSRRRRRGRPSLPLMMVPAPQDVPGRSSETATWASTVQATFAAALVDEWVRAGMRHAVLCPGSRSTPLALAIASRPELSVHVRLDERGAGFFALGLARATGRPAIVCVTSGTAAAELHPAVIEAHHGRVPVIVCTADRPPELHGVGAPQTIEQGGLYGTAVRWSAEPGVAVAETAESWRSLGARAAAEAVSGPLGPGPVHLNLAFRDPLVGSPGPLPPGRPDGRPFHLVDPATAGAGRVAEGASLPQGRGLIVAGDGCGPVASVLALAEHLGWPVLADPRSGCRVDHPLVVGAADAIARTAPDDLRPEVILRLGAGWSSKALPGFVSGATVHAVDPWWRWEDADRSVAVVHRIDPGAFGEAVRRHSSAPPLPGWLAGWQQAERSAQAAIDRTLSELGLCEPLVARRVARLVPGDGTVVVSSSMPVRDLEWFAPAVAVPPRVLANRGANGIDGVCSTALGVAAASEGPVVAVLGDLAFFHDLSALVGSGDGGAVTGAPCTVLVVDNGGGGIFEFLPQAGTVERDTFDRIFGTPQAADVVQAAAGLGLDTADVGTPDALDEILRAASTLKRHLVARVRVPARPGNVEVHRRIHAAVADALRQA